MLNTRLTLFEYFNNYEWYLGCPDILEPWFKRDTWYNLMVELAI